MSPEVGPVCERPVAVGAGERLLSCGGCEKVDIVSGNTHTPLNRYDLTEACYQHSASLLYLILSPSFLSKAASKTLRQEAGSKEQQYQHRTGSNLAFCAVLSRNT